MVTETKIRVGGDWKDVDRVQVKVAGVWEDVSRIETRESGVWETVFKVVSAGTSTIPNLTDVEERPTRG